MIEWEIVYLAVLQISNTLRKLTKLKFPSSGTALHHEVSGNFSKIYTSQVKGFLGLIENRCNPYHIIHTLHNKLHNFVTESYKYGKI